MAKSGREINSDYLNLEMQAMKEGGLTLDEYYNEGSTLDENRLSRAARVGHMLAMRVMQSCAQFDEHEAAKKKSGAK